MRISPINNINSKSYYVQNKNNHPAGESVVNTSFTGAGVNMGVNKGVKELAPSVIKKMSAVFAMLSALKIFSKESKNAFNPDVAVRNIYGVPVGEEDKDYLKKAYVADPQLFTALAKSKNVDRDLKTVNEYSPAEIYGIVKVKQENPVVAYELSNLLKSEKKNGHLESPEEVLFIAEQMQQKKTDLILKKKNDSSRDWYNNLRANDINARLNLLLIQNYENTEGRRLSPADRLAIIEMYAKKPEFVSKMLELKEISVNDLYILEGEYEGYTGKKAIDGLVEFLNENAKNIVREQARDVNIPVSTSAVSTLFDDYVNYPEAVKELCAQNLPIEHVEGLAHIYDQAPGLTLSAYQTYRSKVQGPNNSRYFLFFEDLTKFLNHYIEINAIIEKYEEGRGHLIFSEAYDLVKAYNGDEKNKEALERMVNSPVIKIIAPKEIANYVEYLKENPDKELTKEVLKYAGDPMAKYFGLL